MSDESELKKIRKELELSNKDTVRRRSLINPMFWIGLSFYILGFLLCLTIVGAILGIPMIQGGKAWMYKNYGKKSGL